MNRDDVLAAATKIISTDRAATYGDAWDNFTRIAALWSIYTGHNIVAYDVAQMMVLLKVVRAKANPTHTDTLIDIAGYAALAAEMAPAK